jgi:hypothetical protein
MVRHMTIYGVFHDYRKTNLEMGGLAWVINTRRDCYSIRPHQYLVLLDEGGYG